MEAMAADNDSVDREEQWFTWAQSALGADQARGRAAARAAAAVQGTGAGFTAAAAAARAAYADDGGSRIDPLPWEAKAAPAAPAGSSTPLHSPDGQWMWNGQDWIVADQRRAAVAREPLKPLTAPSKGLSSWVDGSTSEDLFYGQAVIVWARWILIATGLVLSFWDPTSLSILQIQLAAIIALAFGNFYLHVQLLRGHPAIDRVVYAASAADLVVVTTLVIAQGGYSSPVFVFYFAAVLGLSVAFPAILTALYTSAVVVVYGIVCLVTSDGSVSEVSAVFTRLLMIAAIAVCGALFARSESHRRADAIRMHEGTSSDGNLPAGAGDREPAPAGVA
jgi:hypothetical protein